MCISKNLTDLCVMREDTRLKNTFASIIYHVLAVKKFQYNINKID